MDFQIGLEKALFTKLEHFQHTLIKGKKKLTNMCQILSAELKMLTVFHAIPTQKEVSLFSWVLWPINHISYLMLNLVYSYIQDIYDFVNTFCRYSKLDNQTSLSLTIQFSISHLFTLSLNVKQFYLTHR